MSKLQEQECHLVLLESLLPDESGFSLCRRIRSTSDIPIIFLSSEGQVRERVRGFQMGADDCIVKPFEPAELLARIEAVLRRCYQLPVLSLTPIMRGDITLNPITYEAICGDGQRVLLTPTEFRLLCYLMEHAGQVLSIAQILDHVWGHNGSSGRNLLAVHMHRLRSKIERNTGHPQRLVTVEHIRYTFQPHPERVRMVG